MSYRPATHAEIIAALTESNLTDAGRAVGLARLVATKGLKVVDAFDLRLASGESAYDSSDEVYALRRLENEGIADPSEWTILATSFRDETYFDTVDGKWEYCSTDYAVLAPNATLVAEIVAGDFSPSGYRRPEWDHAVKAGYGKYA